MTEKHKYDGDLDASCYGKMGFPRGRSTWLLGNTEGGIFSEGVGRPQLHAEEGRGIGLSQTLDGTPVGWVPGEGPYTLTPAIDRVAFDHLTGQLGLHIGESIVAKLVSAGLVNANTDCQTNSLSYTQTPAHTEQCTHTPVMTPQVTVHMKSDYYTFRGDGSDKYGIEEWVDRTKACLRKQMYPVQDQAKEISRLAGKARDVVKVSLRSDGMLNVRTLS